MLSSTPSTALTDPDTRCNSPVRSGNCLDRPLTIRSGGRRSAAGPAGAAGGATPVGGSAIARAPANVSSSRRTQRLETVPVTSVDELSPACPVPTHPGGRSETAVETHASVA